MSAPVVTEQGLDVARIRADFPILSRDIGAHPLVYLDSAATSQKPRMVVDAVDAYYASSNANVHRGVHTLGNEATDSFERARARVATFLDAPADGLVFVRNTTEAINLVAYSYATQLLEPGDRIVVTVMEHHSNLVPWQLAAERRGLSLAAIDIDDDGRLDLSNLDELLAAPTRLVAIGHQSNVLGTVNDIRTITERAHAAGALVCVDAAQSVPHHERVRSRPGLRLHRVQRAQDVWTDGDRRALGAAGAARTHASLPRWWKHDQPGDA